MIIYYIIFGMVFKAKEQYFTTFLFIGQTMWAFFNKNVVGIYDVTGEYDAFLIAKFRNTSELNLFIKELLKDPIIERTYTQTVLDVIKEDMGSSNIL